MTASGRVRARPPVKTGDPDVGQHRLQRRPVVTLPAGDDERQRPAVPVEPRHVTDMGDTL